MKYKPPKNIREKKAKKEFQKQFWNVFLIEGCLFLITSVLAVVGAFQINKLVKIQKIYLPQTSLQDFLVSFLIITILVLLFVFIKKAGKFKGLVYKGFFILTVFWGGMTILNLWIPVFGSIFIMGILIALWLEFSYVWVHDVLIILGLAGAASFFGLSFSPAVVVVLLVIFSFYDFIAVYKTKHMVAMAKDMIENKVILGFIIPKEIKCFKDNLNKVKSLRPGSGQAGGNFSILGGGDVVFPTLLAVSVVPSGFLKALVVVVFSLIGSLFSYYLFINQKDPSASSGRVKEPIPALPPVALFAIVGYFLTIVF